MEILKIENLSFKYPGDENKTLSDISFSVSEGDFVVLCGSSGCGKTTLMKLIKRELAPFGEIGGKIYFLGKDSATLSPKESASEIGYVLQNPEAQIITDKVWHELSFGLENLGYDSDYIRLRIGEMANYFGIAHMFRNATAELSGGQKQLLSLASVMAMSPSLLLLDEPTSQLDPIAAADFIATLKKINRELGTTVIIAEHRLEELFPIADKVAVMDKGSLIAYDTPRAICSSLSDTPIAAGFPSASRIFSALKLEGEAPLTVREARVLLKASFTPRKAKIRENENSNENALSLSDVYFRYEKRNPDILRGISLNIKSGELFCLLGANGAGKTTVLKALAGLIKPYSGKILTYGKTVAMLPQNVLNVFIKNSVKEDIEEMLLYRKASPSQASKAALEIARTLGVAHLLEKHPYDLSGGEAQKCAMAKILALRPDILLLDEPTKAIDPAAKQELASILKKLTQDGVTVFAVTHDVEFAAENASRCALFFDGEILTPATPQKFFSSNNFYTTAASRISRGIFENAVTANDIIKLARGEEI